MKDKIKNVLKVLYDLKSDDKFYFESYGLDLIQGLIDSKWINVEDKLPPKENEFYPFSIYVVVICQQELNSKKQVANAYYNYETDIWETHWGKVINDVEFWTTKPPKE